MQVLERGWASLGAVGAGGPSQGTVPGLSSASLFVSVAMATWLDAWRSQAQPPSLTSLFLPQLRLPWKAPAWLGKLPSTSH